MQNAGADKKKGSNLLRTLGNRAKSFTFGSKKSDPTSQGDPLNTSNHSSQGGSSHGNAPQTLSGKSDPLNASNHSSQGGSSHGNSVDEEAVRRQEEEERARTLARLAGWTDRLKEAKVTATREKLGAVVDSTEKEALARQMITDFLRKDISKTRERIAPAVTTTLKAKLKDTLTGELGSHTKLLKEVLTAKNHQEAIDKIHDEILERLVPLAEDASEKKLEEFKEWFDAMVESHKKDFPEKNWIWHDVVKPVLKALVGIIVAVATAAFMPFFSGLSGHVYTTFFKKPDTTGFKAFSKEAADVKDKVVNDTDITVGSINILSPGLGG
ncbi:MAG: hypothetical protein P1U32_08900 [Legionellaceae bacterium]|nr:hypothetical protein [Legionellaceae bacterium]